MNEKQIKRRAERLAQAKRDLLARMFLRFGDGFNIVDRPEDSAVDVQRVRWERDSAKLHRGCADDLIPVTVLSRARYAATFKIIDGEKVYDPLPYQSLACFQRRVFL